MTPAARLILDEITLACGVAVSEIYNSNIHTVRGVAARHEILRRIYALKDEHANPHKTAYSMTNIARWFGLHHSTVILAIKTGGKQRE